jgi:hypothetical protein
MQESRYTTIIKLFNYDENRLSYNPQSVKVDDLVKFLDLRLPPFRSVGGKVIGECREGPEQLRSEARRRFNHGKRRRNPWIMAARHREPWSDAIYLHSLSPNSKM